MDAKSESKKFLLSIIAPAFNEEAGVEEFRSRILKILEAEKYTFELIFVNDGSRDGTAMLLAKMAYEDKRIKVINFSRNFGHQLAVSAGFDYAKGDAVVVIDADLQDPPEVIPQLVSKWHEGFEIVNAVRRSRKDGISKRLTAGLFYKFLNGMLTYKIPENVGDFRLIDRKPLDILKSMREQDRYIRGMTNWIGFKQAFVEFDRDKRFAGSTHYPFRKMLTLAMNALFSFSSVPMKLAHWAFALFSLFSVLTVVYIVITKLTGSDVPGWTSQMLITVVFGAIQMFVLAIISEYVGRIYQQGQERPLYIVASALNFPDNKS